MSDTSRIAIEIASEFTGRKAFDKAHKSTSGLEKSVKKLAKTFAGVFAAQKILSFGKASAKAFMADEAAATSLTKTLGNMGLAFEDSRVKNFVSNLEQTSGVLDDQLRPAMQALLNTTGNVTKSQELLKLAVDVSAGSGEKLTTVADDLAQAYVGNTKGLKKYNLGLTQGQLKTMKFADVQDKLNQQFTGQNAARLNTYAGKVDLINVAYANMQETIGKGLVDSFSLLAGDNGIAGATKAMTDFGIAAAETILGIADLIKSITPTSGIKGEPGFWHDLYIAFGGQIIEDLRARGRKAAIKPKPFSTPMSISGQSTVKDPADAARTAAEKAYLKRIKELNALLAIQNGSKTREIALTGDQLALEELKKKFDITRIELNAALNNTVDKETQLRLLSLMAIHDNDAALAGKIKAEQDAAEAAKLLEQAMRNSLAYWGTWQKEIGDAIKNAAILALSAKTPTTATTNQLPTYVPTPYAPGDIPGLSGTRGFAFGSMPSSVNIQINPAVAGLIDVIQNQSASGISPTVNRISSSYIA